MDLVTLAFLGDAVYELSVRRRLAERGGALKADRLHLEAVKYVKASAQARALRGMTSQTALRGVTGQTVPGGMSGQMAMHIVTEENALSEVELDVVRRARNRKPKNVPKNADPLEYKLATAFEALLGYHYAEGRRDRAEELAELAMRIIDDER